MRLLLTITVIVAILALLFTQFPYALDSQQSRMSLVVSLGWLILLLGSGGIALRGAKWKHAALWVAIFSGLVLAYSFRDLFQNNRLMAELMPDRVQTGENGELRLRADERGHFFVVAHINGAPIRFMVDTGASDVVLTKTDAERIGIPLSKLEFTRPYRTANGVVMAAPVKGLAIAIGDLRFENVETSVNEGELSGSLLGMSLLSRFSSYTVEGNTLYLKR